jgi:hypothetical protein
MAHTAKLFFGSLGVTIIGMIQISSATDETKPPVAEVRGYLERRVVLSTIRKYVDSKQQKALAPMTWAQRCRPRGY